MDHRSHFMHQGHPLLQLHNTQDYICGGCKTDGLGTNFGCEPCRFHMHDFCSNCPKTLPSFLHPQHPNLSLMISNTQYAAAPPRICDVCEDTVEGLFYWCQPCEFSVHPLCTQFPPSLRHAVHLSHPLVFQKSYIDAPCRVCNTVCNSWRYRCGWCDGFDVHVDCVALQSVQSSSDDTTSRRLPPWAGLYTYGGVSCTGVSSAVNSQNMNKPPDPYYMYTHNFYGQMPHYMCHSAYPDMNSYYMYSGAPPYDWNSLHGQIHHGDSDTSHQGPANTAQNSPSQGHNIGKIGKKVFRIVSTLTLGVISNVIFGALIAL